MARCAPSCSGSRRRRRIAAYVDTFDRSLTEEEFNSPRFAYRLLFIQKNVNQVGKADRVVEFVNPNSDLGKTIAKEYWVKTEPMKYKPLDVVNKVQQAGFPKFRLQPDHRDLWKAEGAKDAAKGYGVDVAGVWHWYDKWIRRCIEFCNEAGDRYRADPKLPGAATTPDRSMATGGVTLEFAAEKNPPP